MAWLTWLVVHIFFLIGFRNRLSGVPQLGIYVPDAAATVCG